MKIAVTAIPFGNNVALQEATLKRWTLKERKERTGQAGILFSQHPELE